MKKVLFAMGLAAGSLLLTAPKAFSANNASVDVVMSIETISIEAIKVFDPVAAPANGSKVINGRAVFKNLSNAPVDLSIKISSQTGSAWTAVETSPLANQYRVRAIWAAFFATTSSLTTADFNTNDSVPAPASAHKLSSNTVFFKDAADPTRVGTAAANGGVNVPILGIGDNERHLFFCFDAGSQTSGSVTAYVNVLGTASQ